MIQYCEKIKKRRTVRSTFTINSTIVEVLQGRIGGQQSLPIPKWSDCDCKTCTSWTSSCKETLYVKADGAKGKKKTHFNKYSTNALNMVLSSCACMVRSVRMELHEINVGFFLTFFQTDNAQEDVLFTVHSWIHIIICLLD
ncbi:putative lysophospholipase BODYGUARD 3 [Forsythia ovata]|uniref:Lysophospholipase BODYGUARD 3 n=1 Tax=Forsythia ovata TaxID=205694 RepID=A0ABD1UDN1_9LAMI